MEMSSYVGIHIRDQSLQSQLMQVELRSLESKVCIILISCGSYVIVFL